MSEPLLPAGIVLKPGAVVLFGAPAVCTRPAAVDVRVAGAATPEGQEILADRVAEGSARWQILRQRLHVRLRAVAAAVAHAEGFDCVVRRGDVFHARGRVVVDCTAAVVRGLAGTP